MKIPLIRWLTLCLATLISLSTSASNTVPSGQLPETVIPTHYRLDISIDPNQAEFSGTVAIDINLAQSLNEFYIHGKNLIIKKASLQNERHNSVAAQISKTVVDGVLKVTTQKVNRKGKYKLVILYSALFNQNLQGLHLIKDGGLNYAFTQMESIYARYAFPSFDEPRFKTTYDISLTIPDNMVAISNTPEKETKSLGGGLKKVSFETTKPLPTYLIAMAVGELDVVEWQAMPVTAVRKIEVPLRGIATKGKGKQLKYALQNTHEIVEALEDYLQLPYPYKKLDILAVPDFAAGAMENAGAITYREQLLLLDEKASISQKRRYKSVQAHELAHQWFGDLVTPVWWNDIWLNEAFATWMSATALERRWPDEQWTRQQIRGSKGAMNSDSIPSARKIRNPIESNSDIITAFDGITYQKGSGVLSMVESFMGKENFRKGIQKYMKKYAWGNTTAIDFFETIASVLEPKRAKAVIKSFRNFVEQAGVPLLEISKSCRDERTVLDIKQQRYAPLGTHYKEPTLWSIPTCMSYQVDGEIKQQCEVLNKHEEKIKLKISGCADWVMPNDNAAGYYRFNLDSKSWNDLILNLDKLNASEANAVMDSLRSAFASGNLSVSELLDVIPATIDSESWEVAVSGMGTIGQLIDYANDAEKPKLRKIAAELYRERADKIGMVDNTDLDKNNPLDASQLRSRLIGFMANTAKDQWYRNTLKKLGAEYVGFQSDSQFHDDAVIPSMRTLAMSVAVQEYGKPYVNLLLSDLKKTTDGTLRGRLISAMTATENEDLAEQLIDYSLSPDIRDNEKSSFLFALLPKKELDKVMWPWIQKNFDELLKGLPTNYQSYTPYLFRGDCKKEKEERLNSFLKPRLKKLIGADRNFAKAKEYLSQCLVQKAHVKPQITAFLSQM